ncbi:WSC domain-containing protein [Psilocybe cubensis]|uniref:WSC domain-containing protein n=2 Tax=Psilocybe cubensis TaxID=181762 RepID=A0ACB8HB20_PSICU|nr:WSC domain-containing protein [Psilocybe cubensis]KAH9484852.1 WSC domain-containing protein [Psilocybe cubensis]
MRAFIITLTLAHLYTQILANPLAQSLKTRQAPGIKQTVGTWLYKGCYKDFGPRILAFRFDVPGGNSAERCTAICNGHGYGLAGLEYGSECWCDNYMPYGQLMSDSDCSFTCPGDNTELCGAGNRMLVYQDSTATPPSPNTCITWRDASSFINNVLQAVPKSGSGPITKLYAIPTNPFTDPLYYTIISTCPAGCPYTDYYNFGLYGSVLRSYNSLPYAPNVGDSQAFTSQSSAVGYAGFCPKPNPLSSNPFIGYPLLSVSGHTDLWSLCTNTTAGGRQDIVYSPVVNHPHYVKSACQDVWIQIVPYS